MAGSAARRELSGTPARVIDLASRRDDRELRALLRRSVIPGAVRIAFTREPDYFAAQALAGAEDVTVVSRHDGRLTGIARCSVNRLYRNGSVQRVGYLAELRVLPGTPASPRLLRDGYAVIGDALASARVGAFFTSIAVDNERARRVLEQGKRFGLPRYRPLASLVTLIAPVTRGARRRGDQPVGACTEEEQAALQALLREQARGAHLTLAWDTAQWRALAGHGITPADFVAVREGGRIVAAAAVWDQRPFRQTVIDGYEGALRLGRPLANAVQALRGLPHLPQPGSVLAQGAVLGASVTESAAWPPLWRALQARAATLGLSWLAVAFDTRDPQLAALRRLLRAREYRTTLYEVTWGGGPSPTDAWDDRLFRPEVGLL